jgi:hypothetical protein
MSLKIIRSEAWRSDDESRTPLWAIDGIGYDDWDMGGPLMDDAEMQTLAFEMLLALGWSVNGVGQTIVSVTPRDPVPL